MCPLVDLEDKERLDHEAINCCFEKDVAFVNLNGECFIENEIKALDQQQYVHYRLQRDDENIEKMHAAHVAHPLRAIRSVVFPRYEQDSDQREQLDGTQNHLQRASSHESVEHVRVARFQLC